MKILYVTTVGSTMGFFKDFFKELINDGHTVELASNETELDYSDEIKSLGLKTYHLDCSRSPFSFGNIKCIKQIKQIVEENGYDIVHCHTPIAAACTRFACKDIRKKRSNTEKPLKVIYTAHGFHFYKGSPKRNWIVYYPIEWICAHWTDTLITINEEDYNLAKSNFGGLGKSNRLNGCIIEYVLGVGIDVDRFANIKVDRQKKRSEFGISKDAVVLLSVGELNQNKNHKAVIMALSLMKEGIKKYYYLIAGDGPQKKALHDQIEALGLKERVFLLGYRTDCAELYKMADLFIHPSFREGLPVSVMEAEATGLVCVGSNIRGNRDLMHKENLFSVKGKESCLDEMINVIEKHNNERVDVDNWDVKTINKKMQELYGSL